MDHLILSYEEQKFITKHQTLLESTFHVRISLPDGVNTPTHKHDRIVANVQGKHEKIHELKKFIEKKMEVQKQKHEQRITVKSNVPVITLSDSSDSDSLNNVIFQNQQKAKKRKQMKVSSETPANCSSNKIKLLGDLVVPVTSGNLSNSNESPPAPSFIPLSSAEQIDILEPVEKEQRFLRPIVIDGTNVALEHGKHKNTFSCRGLKIAIDYFLQKGHENVTAFVPLHRLERKNYYPFATDHFLLEELEKLGRVVCTPSRIVNDRRVTCYEGRFIVDLATLTGGVIVSNDKYRDLVEESEAYKKTIEKRLLIFCFDGDDFLIPKDPLGVNGPGVDEFLSMSATEKNLFSSAQPQ